MLITAIILAIVILITASIAMVALAESVQTATFVDSMAKKVTKEFTMQQHINKKNLARLQAVEAAIEYLGERQDTLAYKYLIAIGDISTYV